MNCVSDAINTEMEETRPIILNFPWENPEAYGMWLAQTYHMVCYSTRIVALAGALTKLDDESLHNRFIDHSREERGHPRLCLIDLKNINRDITQYPKMYQAISMYQCQYYWLERKDPAAFFGYGLSLECLATNFGKKLYEKVSNAYGKKAANFLRVHAEEDDDHVDAAFEEVKKLSETQKEYVIENLTNSTKLYRSMLIEIEEKTQSKKTNAA